MQSYLPSQGWGDWLGTSLILTTVDYPFRCSVVKKHRNPWRKAVTRFLCETGQATAFHCRLLQWSTVRLHAGFHAAVELNGRLQRFKRTIWNCLFHWLEIFPHFFLSPTAGRWRWEIFDPCFCLSKQSHTRTALTVSVLQSLRNDLVWWQHGGAVEEM